MSSESLGVDTPAPFRFQFSAHVHKVWNIMNEATKTRNSIFARSFSSSKSKHRRSRRLKVENLEGRRLMAATWGLSGGELTINADAQGSQVHVTDLNPYNNRYSQHLLLVSATSDDGSWTIPLPKSAIEHVNFVGSRYDDIFTMNTGYRFLGLVQPSPGAASVPDYGTHRRSLWKRRAHRRLG